MKKIFLFVSIAVFAFVVGYISYKQRLAPPPLPSISQEIEQSPFEPYLYVSYPELKKYLDEFEPTQKIKVPPFGSGKFINAIAFIKDGNLWEAQSLYRAAWQITKDASQELTAAFNISLQYAHPIYAPSGTRFAFEQITNLSSEYRRILLTDGGVLVSPYNFAIDRQLSIAWLGDDKLLTPAGAIVTNTLSRIPNEIVIEGSNFPGDPFFPSYNKIDGCGGGGRPGWLNQLSWNHNGGLDGIRSTFLYIPKNQRLIYSTGCENEKVETMTMASKTPKLFNNEMPQELTLSPDNTLLAGIINKNIALYDIEGQLIKQLTHTNKAYGPVFSHYGQYIYYADNFGDKPILAKIKIDGTDNTNLFEGKQIGAISNISPSPDDYQLVFTLIEQTQPPREEEGDFEGKIQQNLYLIDTDGSGLTLFVKNASQGAWSPWTPQKTQ